MTRIIRAVSAITLALLMVIMQVPVVNAEEVTDKFCQRFLLDGDD